MKAFYSDVFVLPLPAEHRFPMLKYRALRDAIEAEGIVPSSAIAHAPEADDEALLRVHEAAYVARVREGTLSPAEQRRIGFPWSPALARRSVTTVGATVAAARAALSEGVAVNLAGGTHHAFPDHGEGYCVFNDVAVTARALQAEGLARRVVILDGDVHQGNGTAAVFRDDPTVYTFSIHGAKNYPFRKEQSDLDIELLDGTGDADYLALWEEGVQRAIAAAGADVAVYLAGADPFAGDRLGRMAVSKAGLLERDRVLFAHCAAAGLPVVVTMAGGYAPNIADIVSIHAATVREAARWAR
jgi:acetoin utilization deacetylase AcuC-like enzyme